MLRREKCEQRRWIKEEDHVGQGVWGRGGGAGRGLEALATPTPSSCWGQGLMLRALGSVVDF